MAGPTSPIARALILTAALTLAACGPAAEDVDSRGQAGADVSPVFEGPYAAEFAEYYASTSSDFARSALVDGQISDSEYAEMEERFRACLEDEGMTFSGFDPDGSYSTSSAPNGVDTHEAVSHCVESSGQDTVGLLHDLMRDNPENLDIHTIMAACLVTKEAMPDGYDAEAYSEDLEGRFMEIDSLSSELRQALISCSADPLALHGE